MKSRRRSVIANTGVCEAKWLRRYSGAPDFRGQNSSLRGIVCEGKWESPEPCHALPILDVWSDHRSG